MKPIKQTNVVELDKHRPHHTGLAKCTRCAHEWTAVYVRDREGLECPECGRMTGQIFDDENIVVIIFRGKTYRAGLMNVEGFEAFLEAGFKEIQVEGEK